MGFGVIHTSGRVASLQKIAIRYSVRSCLALTLTTLLVCLVCPRVYADVGVILNESLDTSVERVTGSGHSAVYFSRICPESPVKLRLCRRDEEGSVMSNYINIGEERAYEWNIVPLNVYLYGVEDPDNRPIFGSQKVKEFLENSYRDKMLLDFCSSNDCRTSNKSEWREMVGAGMSRSMYIFVVHTTVRQDLDLIAKFNALPNENQFNGATHNCADFTKNIVDTYFPHSAHRDPINDFGITSPKAVARTFTHYAQSHPESEFRVLHISQLPGTIKRSTEARSATEQLYHAKKLLVPMLIFAPQILPAVAATYELTGRFNPEHEFEAHSSALPVQIRSPMPAPRFESVSANIDQSHPAESHDREGISGTPKKWKAYREEFDFIVKDAVRQELLPNREYLDHILEHFQETGIISADSKGALWLVVSSGGETSQVGISASNILAPGSDPKLAFALLLACINQALKSPKHSRETMVEFKGNWALLQYARMRILPTNTAVLYPPSLATAIRTGPDN
jgi:hypothetical protein